MSKDKIISIRCDSRVYEVLTKLAALQGYTIGGMLLGCVIAGYKEWVRKIKNETVNNEYIDAILEYLDN